MDLHEYERRLARPTKLKLPEFERNRRLKHVLFAEQFDRGLLDHFARTALRVRALSRNKDTHVALTELLPHKRAMLYFTQASTRTFLSFTAACQLLGMPTAEIRDPSVSSEYKGESPVDSMRMFSSYFDLIVMRSSVPRLAECCAYLMNDLDEFNQRSVPIINGGSGADEHPTQALLDIFTIQRTFQFESNKDSSEGTKFDSLRQKYPHLSRGLGGKSYGFVGDIGRGRTVRSLSILLAQYPDVEMHFVTPPSPTLRLQNDLRDWLLARGVKVREHSDLKSIIADLDLLYMTRIQSEHDHGDSPLKLSDLERCRLTPALVALMKEYAPILHPFPRNEEIPTSTDQDPRAMYFRQARNGIWIRAALIAHLFDVDGRIEALYSDATADYHSYNEEVL